MLLKEDCNTLCWHEAWLASPSFWLSLQNFTTLTLLASTHKTPVGSAAMIVMSGLRLFAAMEMPDIKPPPETGTMIASREGTCSNNSSPTVPWHAEFQVYDQDVHT